MCRNIDPIDRWAEIRRGYAAQLLSDVRAAERQVRATMMHNPSPEWLEELERCKKAVVPVS
ncbi:MAG TPA: hypothetical protein VHF01_19345 [Candidatus Acidoferrum sp.]|nr:hypothetical protein [Candidatus Acidoferrum sp.]